MAENILKSSSEQKNKDLKRKADSPRLVLESRTAKKAKIVTSKTLQNLLINKKNIADHIQVNFSHEPKLNFKNLVKFSERSKAGCVRSISQPPKLLPKFAKNTDSNVDNENSEIIEVSHWPSYSFIKFKKTTAKDLELKYAVIFPFQLAYFMFEKLESEIRYNKESKIKLFGKWFDVPRKQVAFGDSGLTYTFSGKTVKAQEWTPITRNLLYIVNKTTNQNFNFVLINRYKNGRDHIGEHRDDEVDLDPLAPIASLSFGAARDFVFRHKDHRHGKATVKPVTLKLESGSLLIMNPPTNQYWYHSLPIRKNCLTPRINLTFRKIIKKE